MIKKFIRRVYRKSKPSVAVMTIRGHRRERTHGFPRLRNMYHRIIRLCGLASILIANFALSASFDTRGNGVKRVIAGTNITVSPTSGEGSVTVNATGGGGGITDLTGPVTASGTGSVETTIVGPVPTGAVNLSTVTTALALKADKGNTAHIDLSTVTTAIALKVDKNSPDQVNLSTVTTALAGKVPVNDPSYINLSTVTTALAGKQASGSYITSLTGPVTASGPGAAAVTIVGPVPNTAVDLSTITTALGLKINTSAIGSTVQAWDADLDDLADGSLTASKVGSGYPAANLGAGVVPITVRVPPDSVDLSTVTTALSGKQESFTGSAIGPCGTSQYIGGATTVNGVITGGSCTDDTGGAGGGETNTYTSSKTFTSNVEARSTMTVMGNAFSVGGSTFIVSGGSVTIGHSAVKSNARLDVAGAVEIDGTLTIEGTEGGQFQTTFTATGDLFMDSPSTVAAFNLSISSMLALNTNQGSVFNSSGVIGYWMINQSSRAIKAGETVQDSSGTVLSPQGVIGTIALATTTIMGVSIDNIPINGWGRIAVAGYVKVWCGIAGNCRKGWRVQAAGGAAATIGRATGATAPAAASDIGTWAESAAINTQGWVRLGR